jgi:D-arabinose 1-dehydrogenase-like Zn-dependent alcohol dehydrogenase
MPSTVFKGSENGKIIKSTSSREIRPDEALVRITHSGLCGTDEHYKHKDMGLFHEGVGVVEVCLPISISSISQKKLRKEVTSKALTHTNEQEIGSAVKTLRKGDRVGWGYEHDCCMECK